MKSVRLVLACLAVSMAATSAFGAKAPDQVGIFDLKAIHAVPLDPEILSKTKQGAVNIEEVRFTSLTGVRAYAIITYKDGAKGAPGYMVVDRFKARPLIAEAANGFFGISVAAPTGNADPSKKDSVGGPVYKQPFSIMDQLQDDKNQSYIYQYTVALTRMLDYLETRPEVNLGTTAVTGFSWAGTMVALLHAIDDRPGCYILYHGLGAYADEQGMSGGFKSQVTRKQYEMYCPAAYAQFGTKPIFIGTALDDYYTKLDAIVTMYNNLKSPKVFSLVPNRHHMETQRGEFASYIGWEGHWVFGTEAPQSVGEGSVKVDGGKVIYTCAVDAKVPPQTAEIMVSYGHNGNWLARTWHRFPLANKGDHYEGEIPIYDASVPFYVVAQIATNGASIANGLQYFVPAQLGVTKSNATYPTVLFDPGEKDDLYLRGGAVTWSADGPDAKGSANLPPGLEGSVMFQNIDGCLWGGRQTFDIWLKGDGGAGPVNLYFAVNPNFFLDNARESTKIELVPTGSTFATGWKEYSVPLSKIKNLENVSALFIDAKGRAIQIGSVLLK